MLNINGIELFLVLYQIIFSLPRTPWLLVKIGAIFLYYVIRWSNCSLHLSFFKPYFSVILTLLDSLLSYSWSFVSYALYYHTACTVSSDFISCWRNKLRLKNRFSCWGTLKVKESFSSHCELPFGYCVWKMGWGVGQLLHWKKLVTNNYQPVLKSLALAFLSFSQLNRSMSISWRLITLWLLDSPAWS